MLTMKGLHRTSMAESHDIEHDFATFIKYHTSEKGKPLQGMLRYFNYVATKLCDFMIEFFAPGREINILASNVRIG